MRLLVIYGSTDGQTQKVASAIGDAARRDGVDAVVADAKHGHPPDDLDAFDAVIVAASVHVGGYQSAIRRWVSQQAPALARRRTAFVSVCLGMLQHDPKVDRDIGSIMQRFFSSTKWTPSITKLVAGAVPFTRYGWWKRRVMKRIMAKMIGAVDTTHDYEYTDWNDVAEFTRHFVAPAASVTCR